MKLLFFTLLLCFSSRLCSQGNPFMTDAYGRPIHPQQKFNWEGNIYFPENYTYANITATNGKVYYDVKVKINLQDNSLLYTDSTDTEFASTMLISKVKFTDMPDQSKAVFLFINMGDAKGYYQLLDSGKISLLKQRVISYQDKAEYGNTNMTRIFKQNENYFAYSNSFLKPIARSTGEVLILFADKKQLLETYTEKEKLKLRKEQDLVKLFHYYNSL
jgi:hypothetical protein